MLSVVTLREPVRSWAGIWNGGGSPCWRRAGGGASRRRGLFWWPHRRPKCSGGRDVGCACSPRTVGCKRPGQRPATTSTKAHLTSWRSAGAGQESFAAVACRRHLTRMQSRGGEGPRLAVLLSRDAQAGRGRGWQAEMKSPVCPAARFAQPSCKSGAALERRADRKPCPKARPRPAHSTAPAPWSP
ncbi:hypothetical protein T440DRAFT_478391 [Plenodomus tracheiphilus IPT5]|uniref:Uncharacterized protein n=1 Tax=Plenodomus tracheiphilus IPT5 TaxID=1408161 RepID=A0A6A7B7S0_9PLEO|nr:hypothetical protein T440DRAFT_478391 [Plenodomus tracheiphilus IPT5]